MARSRAPNVFEQFHLAEFVYRHAAPVSRRTCWLQPTLAVSAVLVTQHPGLLISIPTQAMRAQQPMAAAIRSRHRPPAEGVASDQLVRPARLFHPGKLKAHCSYRISAPSAELQLAQYFITQ